jgi:SagB-type dehydrogenase family enzyme
MRWVKLTILALFLIGCRLTSESMPFKRSYQPNSTPPRPDQASATPEAVFETIPLPKPKLDSNFSVERALQERRSVRDYKDEALTLTEISQLLWAAQGITDPQGFRTSPSAGALYPLETYLVTRKVETLPQGIYKYQPNGHQLTRITTGDIHSELVANLWGQGFKKSSILIVFAAVYERTTQKYGDRGIRYVYMEVGHAAQNVYLQAISLGLGTVVIGAFDNAQVKSITKMAAEEQPLYIMPAGKR